MPGLINSAVDPRIRVCLGAQGIATLRWVADRRGPAAGSAPATAFGEPDPMLVRRLARAKA